jgi:diacylglycerol kinase family enzyme
MLFRGKEHSHFFVINPHSFRTLKSIKRILTDLESCFSVGRRTEYKIYISRYSRDAIAAVHRYLVSVPADEIVRVYAVGGDGILFDCLNGMVDFPNAELTSVPYGSANDFVRAFGENAYKAFRDLKKLTSAPSMPMDIIHCGTNYALLAVNIGIVGKTLIIANEFLRKSSSILVHRHVSNVYSFSAIKAIMDRKLVSQHYDVHMDGADISGHYGNIQIANTACDGGKYTPSPYAIPNDGWLDAIFIKSKNRLDAARVVLARNNGQFEKYKMCSYSRCREINVKSETPLCIQMDGEAMYAREISVKIIPNGIKIFAPEGIGFVDYSHKAYKKGGAK